MGHRKVDTNRTSRINVIAAARIVANKATSDREPDPTKSFPTIILLGETENRLSLALASIPVFWPIVTKTWDNFIFVTHEIKVETTTRDLPNQLELGEIGRKDGPATGIARVNIEDETTEAGLRHPGRLCEVDQYIRQLISPFAEAQEDESATLAAELHRGFTEESEGYNLDFETVPEMARSSGLSMDVGPPSLSVGTDEQRGGSEHFNVDNIDNA